MTALRFFTMQNGMSDTLRTNRYRVSTTCPFNLNSLIHSFYHLDLCALMTLDCEPKSSHWNPFLADAFSSTTLQVFRWSLREWKMSNWNCSLLPLLFWPLATWWGLLLFSGKDGPGGGMDDTRSKRQMAQRQKATKDSNDKRFKRQTTQILQKLR